MKFVGRILLVILGLLLLLTVFWPYFFSRSLSDAKGIIVLDLQTGDMDVRYRWFDGYKSYQSKLPDRLRSRVQVESLRLSPDQRYLTIKPASYHWETGSGMEWALFYRENWDALGIWLEAKPEAFGPRLREYQQYLLAANQAGHLPKFVPIPEASESVFHPGDEIKYFREHAAEILQRKIGEQ